MEKHILICGERGVGKSTLIRRLLAEMKDQLKIEEDPDGDPDNPTSGTITVSGLWKYNLDGSRINYSVEETTEGDGKGDGRLDADDGIAADDVGLRTERLRSVGRRVQVRHRTYRRIASAGRGRRTRRNGLLLLRLWLPSLP